MTDRKDPKKSESLEVRVPWRLKQEFMARARREGRSASEVIRDLMQDYVRRPAQRKATQTLETAMTAIRKRPAPAFAAILGAAGISAVLASAIPAGAAPDLTTEFHALDANGDGAVTTEELEGRIKVDPIIVSVQESDAATRGMGRAMLLPRTDEAGVRRILLEQTTPPPAGGEPPSYYLTAHLVALMAHGDADGDGKLSLDEYVARHEWIRDQSFTALDVNGDDAITPDEVIAVDWHHDPMTDQIIEALHALDADRDGRITRAEYEDAV